MRARALALAGAAALALSACGGESDGTFDFEGFPFTFSYPDDFEETDDIDAGVAAGAAPAQSVGVGIGENDGLLLQSYALNVTVTDRNLPRVKVEIDRLVRELDAEAGPTELTEVGGRPALAVDNLAVPSLDDGLSDITFIFDGDQEYLVNCQSTPDHRDEIDEACAQALETLTFE